MSWLLSLLAISFISLAADKALQLPADISFVSSIDGPYDAKYSSALRHRVSVKNSLGGEGPQRIVFEKFAPGHYGSADKIIFQNDIEITSLPKVKEFADEIAKKSVEATYGCCSVKDVTWNDYQVRFKIQREKKSFTCETTEFADEKFKITCK